MGTIKCVIFDWAGTTIDYGCFAPIRSIEEEMLERYKEIVRNKFLDAGAHYVIDSISELPELIKSFDR